MAPTEDAVMLASIPDPRFLRLREVLRRYPRMHGVYKLELVDIRPLRQRGLGQEDVLDALHRQWADHEAIAA